MGTQGYVQSLCQLIILRAPQQRLLGDQRGYDDDDDDADDDE